MESVLDLKPYLQISLHAVPGEYLTTEKKKNGSLCPGDADWATMQRCVDRLRPLASATEDVERDDATLLTVLKYGNIHGIYLRFIFIPIRHLDLIRAHWSDQSYLMTFHSVALAALEKRVAKHFSGGIFLLVKALDPETGTVKELGVLEGGDWGRC